MKKLILSLLLAFSGSVFSQTSGELLQTKLNAIRSMTADFKQVVKAKQREVSRSSGTMALERPGRFRWQTKQPMEQLVVADGKKMWVYDVDLEQVTVKKQEKGLGGTAALFLSGYDDTVARDFDVTQKNEGTTITFNLKSKSVKANFQRIKLIFTADNLTGLELHDQLGQTTTVKLSQIKSNPKLAEKLFQFKPPKGVDVVKQ
ncbi:outer membrane lipoprotein chaperone LolA [Legionella maioricensis]|uniref:Outer-membrane lipoprotein carrier protein n=1 Tax=Legionella maioricensis TaxID=2896528 RepID=A0A9X2D1A6_9GAMM|nr:outer membrane lipoprotein chaperone LolA [Legionella maioricensis]MCL9684333.1 outer membrane lipoprotein chaperone LolA [Legionella maioricensis]MCL9688761.1 outer membrane lipoprotein chaperone LolA [Legionella maioricensis]